MNVALGIEKKEMSFSFIENNEGDPVRVPLSFLSRCKLCIVPTRRIPEHNVHYKKKLGTGFILILKSETLTVPENVEKKCDTKNSV